MYWYDMTKLNYDTVRFGAVHLLPVVNQSGMPYVSADLIGNIFVTEFRSQSHEVTELVTCCSKWHLRFLDYSCIVIASQFHQWQTKRWWLWSTKKQTIQQQFKKKKILRAVKLPSVKTLYTLKFHNCTIFFSSPNGFLSYRPNNTLNFFLRLLLLFLFFLFLLFFLLLLTMMSCTAVQHRCRVPQ